MVGHSSPNEPVRRYAAFSATGATGGLPTSAVGGGGERKTGWGLAWGIVSPSVSRSGLARHCPRDRRSVGQSPTNRIRSSALIMSIPRTGPGCSRHPTDRPGSRRSCRRCRNLDRRRRRGSRIGRGQSRSRADRPTRRRWRRLHRWRARGFSSATLKPCRPAC